MMVVGTTTAATTRTTTAETIVTITATFETTTTATTMVAGLIWMATEIAAMAITISATTSEDMICVILSTREPMIVHPTRAIAVWNMILPTARRV